MRSWRRLAASWTLWLLVVAAIGAAVPCLGGDPAVRPGQRLSLPVILGDPQQWLDRMFGPASEEEKAALAKIEVTAREELQMGQAVVDAYLADLKRQCLRVVSRGKDVAYLEELIRAVRPFTANLDRYRDIRVYVAQSPRCEARVFPGGTMIFFRGLLESAGNEAAVVGIVGHELSHLDRGHLLSRARRVKLAERTFSGKMPVRSPEQFFLQGASGLRLWTHPFAPEDEREADGDGARWAYLAGYDPREMGRLFVESEKRQGGERLPLPEFLRSHPAAAERRDAIERVYGELQRTQPQPALGVGRENLRRRVPLSRQRWPE